ncbi:hypothetical protein [Porphyromonas canoris]|uniref:Uncharacterized protein n=1 Tax=Porphyromonas canoris TaxID=36875 RepID=A0ABR4XL57_9PORP|nr:hypothetical protein [Porphyromonas canoris]KGN92657.1 hypothetical protein HQ43_03920 [Porphyromonas canoris]
MEIFQPNRRLDLGVAQAPHYLCDEKETASICYAISGTEDEEAEVQSQRAKIKKVASSEEPATRQDDYLRLEDAN